MDKLRVMNQTNSTITITKHNGERVTFVPEKLKKGLFQAGANEKQADIVIREVEKRLFDGISTQNIYQTAYRILKKISRRAAGRYKLKQAVMEMGPSGYPFEKLIGKLFEYKGYTSEIGKIVRGLCVSHEVDVVAKNDHEQIMVECKFHRDPGYKSDVKIPLYINSRFLDVQSAWKKIPALNGLHFTGMIATNTRFSEDAIDYARCAGLRLLSWDYPEDNSLKKWIDQSGFHPVTSLSSLKKVFKQKLLEDGVILCRELADNQETLRQMGMKPEQISRVLQEAEAMIL